MQDSTPSIQVLLIDDEHGFRDELQRQLRSRDMEVTPARSGPEGIEMIRQREFDVVLCDLNMPDGSGMEVMHAGLALQPALPFIIMTGHGSIELGVLAMQRGAYHFISKPTTPACIDEIAAQIQRAHEHAQTQRKLRRSEALLSQLLETVPDIVYSLDVEGRFLSLNTSCERILGFSPGSLLGRSILELIHPEDRDRVEADIRGSVTRKETEPRVLQFRMNTASGQFKHFEIHSRCTYEGQGLARIDGVAHDITTQKALEAQLLEKTQTLELANQELHERATRLDRTAQELARANAEFYTIFNTVQNGFVLVDRDDRVTATNRAARALLMLEQVPTGTPMESFFRSIEGRFIDPARFRAVVQELRGNPDHESPRGVDFHHLFYSRMLETSGDRRLFLSIFSMAIKGEDGQDSGRIWIFADFTRFKEADELLHTIVKVSPVPLIITRIDSGEILFANEHLGRLVGIPHTDLVGRSSMEFYADERDRQALTEILMRDGEVKNYELRLRRADGTTFWGMISLVVAEIGGEPSTFGGVTDISERKATELNLQDESNFIKAILDTAGALILVLDREGRIVLFNKASEETTGYSFEEVNGKAFWEIFLLPEELHEIRDNFRNIFAGDFPHTYENHWLTKKGDSRFISWSNSALVDAAGDVEYVIATGIDITEQRQAAEKLKLYREIFMNAKDAILVLDTEGRIIERNPTHRSFVNVPDELLYGKDMSWLLGDENAATLKRHIAQAAAFHGELRLNLPSGVERFVEISMFPIHGDTGNLLCFSSIGRDITERKKILRELERTNQELQDKQGQLVQSEKMAALGMLVAGIAHEINTPIGAVNSMHDTLVRSTVKLKATLEPLLPGGIEENRRLKNIFNAVDSANQVINSGTQRVTTIVKRLKSFARLDEAELARVDIHEGLEDTLAIIHHEIKHTAEVIRDYGEVPRLACFPGRLNQVFLNLLINAGQSILAKGEIRITTRTEGDRAIIEISDNGGGIPPENLERIFDPGFTTKGVGVGTGLGLSICYQIIMDHHGDISVVSEVGRGTSFTISIPTTLDERRLTGELPRLPQ